MQIAAIHRAVLAVTLLCLAGCTGIEANVQASGVAGVASPAVATATATRTGAGTAGALTLPGAQTYRVASAPAPGQQGATAQAGYEALLRDALAAHGLVDSAANTAHYMLSVAVSTRPASVGVRAGNCATAGTTATVANGTADPDCAGPSPQPLAWFGQRSYRHALSLRFFDRMSGVEVYKVSAVIDDHDESPSKALPLLVKSALARLPFDGAGQWRVKLQLDDRTEAPAVVSIEPAQPR